METKKQDTIEEQPKPETIRTQNEYFFPGPPFSCKAASLEEATKQYEQFKKGSAINA